ncbi:hypothetical protein P8C59_000475 [Phyllachora maydis]|uniref:Uncharacterized protein n=1 Tax=Phyllachora maydis TaxID=1825666 RepID=A0AAD9HXA2_9PEZI|nr:hypothetical protein P8C59_000475 [Phyllachora maydis]
MAPPDGHASPARVPGLEPGQGDVITQTITHPFTTVTVLVTLGGGGSDGPTAAPLTAGSDPGALASASVTSAAGSGPTPGPIGAVVGSVLGLVLLAAVLWACAVQERRRRSAALREARRQRRRFYGGGEFGGMAQGQRPQRAAWLAAVGLGGGVNMPGTSLNPPPTWIRPTRYTPYRQTREPQIRGVRPFPG